MFRSADAFINSKYKPTLLSTVKLMSMLIRCADAKQKYKATKHK